jgi:hypothetical protein
MRLTIRTSIRRFASHQVSSYIVRYRASHGFHLRQREIAPFFSFRQFSLDSSSSPIVAKEKPGSTRTDAVSQLVQSCQKKSWNAALTVLENFTQEDRELLKKDLTQLQKSLFRRTVFPSPADMMAILTAFHKVQILPLLPDLPLHFVKHLLKESSTLSDADMFLVFTTLQKIGFNENYLHKESTNSIQQSIFSLLMKFCSQKENCSFLVEKDLKDFFSFLKARKPQQKDKINSQLFYKTLIPFLTHFLLTIHENPSLLRSRESFPNLLFHLGGLHLHYHQFKLDNEGTEADFSAILMDCFGKSLQSVREEQSSSGTRMVRRIRTVVVDIDFISSFFPSVVDSCLKGNE